MFSFKAQPFATQLVQNRQGGQLRELQVFRGKMSQEHTLAEIVIHTSVALQCVGSGSLAQPLYALMTNPSTMKVNLAQLINALIPANLYDSACMRQNRYAFRGTSIYKNICMKDWAPGALKTGNAKQRKAFSFIFFNVASSMERHLIL